MTPPRRSESYQTPGGVFFLYIFSVRWKIVFVDSLVSLVWWFQSPRPSSVTRVFSKGSGRVVQFRKCVCVHLCMWDGGRMWEVCFLTRGLTSVLPGLVLPPSVWICLCVLYRSKPLLLSSSISEWSKESQTNLCFCWGKEVKAFPVFCYRNHDTNTGPAVLFF